MRTSETDRGSGLDVPPRSANWISQGLEQLVCCLADRKKKDKDNNDFVFDVVIVGSGYGGAIAAAELAGSTSSETKISVCVLERGKEYLPGTFPSRMADLAGHLRCSTAHSPTAMGRREGLFDLRVGPDVCALVANGLGGGSLINAGVMEKPLDAAFAQWPSALKHDLAENDYFQRAKQMLGATVDSNGGDDNTIERHPTGVPLKHQALRAMSAFEGREVGFRSAAITVAMSDKRNNAGVELKQCLQCGDCATGCNHSAKESLDTNLLVSAWRRGADIVTGATVHRIVRAPDDKSWALDVFYTDEKLRKRQGPPFQIRARKVILAAGTFGTTEILLRSSTHELQFSRALGQHFSSNGDSIFVVYDQKQEVNAVADEAMPAAERKVGPTITGMIDRRAGIGVVVQELAIPGPLRRLLEEVSSTAWTLHQLEHPDDTQHAPEAPETDPCAVDKPAVGRSSVLVVLGDDSANGALELVGDDAETHGDGAIRVRWPELRDHRLFGNQVDLLEALVRGSSVGGRVLPNPLWRLLPKSMDFLLDHARGPLFTVHPLGGCPMAATKLDGVVDDCGRVFNAATTGDRDPHPDLVVLDGSIIPNALGINPALTIAAVSLRAVEKLRQDWGYARESTLAPKDATRPVFRVSHVRESPKPTQVEVVERMSGKVRLAFAGRSAIPCVIELTLQFRPLALASLMGPMQRHLDVDPDKSVLRVFGEAEWNALRELGADEEKLKGAAVISAKLSGTLRLLYRETSTPDARRKRSRCAWFWNRGLRDSWQWLKDVRRKQGCVFTNEVVAEARRRNRSSKALATRAGEARLFEYNLTIDQPDLLRPRDFVGPIDAWAGASIRGSKRLTYSRRSNPWRQLREMCLEQFPGLAIERPVLELDTKYLAQQRIPLFRIVDQEDQPSALVDVASFGLYLLRLLLNIHIWSFRRPDAAEQMEPQRLPGIVPGLPPPQIKELEVDQLPNGTPVRARLTRYPNYRTTRPPVVMIHGYSASGNTFAHHAVKPNLAQYLHERKRDVWILDLRTSSGMPTARHPWNFEDAALADIPAALDYILRETKTERKTENVSLDIVAHCMGAAMLSMALLGPPKEGERFFRERTNLPGWLNKVVLSQVGPVVVFSPDNIFRSYVMSYLRYFLPFANYEFRVGPDPSLADQLIDRLLATMPYPEEEFDLENPPYAFWRRTAFVGTRHRMDALYGRDFSLRNVDRIVLKHIDDLFGPLSIETVSQAIHFARLQQITNRRGRNEFVTRANMKHRWKGIPTLSVHGMENALADVATLGRMERVLKDDSEIDFKRFKFASFGHQDSLIGRDSRLVFEQIGAFLDSNAPRVTDVRAAPAGNAAPTGNAPAAATNAVPADTRKLHAEIPSLGPMIGPLVGKSGLAIPVGAGANPALGQPVVAVYVPVVRCRGNNERFCVFPGEPPPVWYMFVPFDPDGWMRLSPSADRWPSGAEGVLMVLFYDQPGVLGEIAYLQQRVPKPDGAGMSSDDQFPFPVPQSPPQFVSIADSSSDASDGILDRYEQFIALWKKLLGTVADSLWAAIVDLLDRECAAALLPGLIALPESEQRRRRGKTSEEPPEVHFALASCQYPAGMLDDSIADASFRSLVRRFDPTRPLRELPRPELLLLVGDQVYVDATAGLFDPSALDDRYRRPYEKLLGVESLRSLVRRVPTYMMLDDHEIDDNWEPGIDDIRIDPRVEAGREAYWKFERRNVLLRPAVKQDSSYPLWDDGFFSAECFPFFMADTRTERSRREATSIDAARIMSKGQFQALLNWLHARQKANPTLPKFIVSASILLPRKLRAVANGHPASALRSDAWEGFPYSFHRLLAEIAKSGIQNVVFLSGDEHLSCVARAELRSTGQSSPVVIHSIHSSALYAPFPFANALPEDFAAPDDCFNFNDPEGGTLYHCTVSTQFAYGGDGFAVLHVTRENGRWRLLVEFDRNGQLQVIPCALS
jgi:choline dehydrogenase-like flavoprotein/phosphodiesterase/alkaline phosphatase D-like protein/pimeloyl-ACP methyl ester carboxylesterase